MAQRTKRYDSSMGRTGVNEMAQVDKCDNCGILQNLQNPVASQGDTLYLRGKDQLVICISLPSDWQRADLCQNCVADIIRARFAEICGLIAPYQPMRVPGFIQDTEEAPLSGAERKALAVLKHRVLKAAH